MKKPSEYSKQEAKQRFEAALRGARLAGAPLDKKQEGPKRGSRSKSKRGKN